MLAVRSSLKPIFTSRLLATSATYSGTLRSTIKEGNPFWLDHQRTSKEGFHKHILTERYLSFAMLGSIPLSIGAAAVGMPLMPLDVFSSLGIVYHTYHGIANMISDYVPLIHKGLVAPLKYLFGIFCLISAALWINFNVESVGFGKMIWAVLKM